MTENTNYENYTFNKRDEITKITDELKSHYYKNEFFVDPDKKFIDLLQRITVRNLKKNNKKIYKKI